MKFVFTIGLLSISFYMDCKMTRE